MLLLVLPTLRSGQLVACAALPAFFCLPSYFLSLPARMNWSDGLVQRKKQTRPSVPRLNDAVEQGSVRAGKAQPIFLPSCLRQAGMPDISSVVHFLGQSRWLSGRRGEPELPRTLSVEHQARWIESFLLKTRCRSQ